MRTSLCHAHEGCAWHRLGVLIKAWRVWGVERAEGGGVRQLP